MLADLWDRMNPAEPTPAYLVKFMGFIVSAMALALLVGAVV